ncbi:TonB family protein [Flavihumibacter stibioxidans]|uniref:TonB C-terminal domain-containing protein n=1 Tax=Flavihumibacter stibioxidans TaxID=1834163 RepID=A0ABR7M611_9BACT|nr:TonB family protein [Flavihumibacter stibioxidans]MBC6490459.1 hypothetical protein [Flavihumibacter stibioxidans]
MKPSTILRSDALDILFENRNKQYGAYALRRNYPRHLYYGLGGMILLVILSILISRNSGPGPNLNGGIVSIFTIPDTLEPIPPPAEPTPPPPPTPAEPPRVAQEKHTTIIVVPDKLSEPIPEQTRIDSAAIGPVSLTGTKDDGITGPSPAAGSSTGPAAPIPPPAEKEPEILETASVMPSFPGGAGALQRWLSRQLRPQDEQDSGERIRVVVRFVVNDEGEIDQVQLSQPAGDPYDREVLRVIKKMPRWEPGQQKGRPVSVWFTIPVIFVTPEQ